MCVCVCVWLVGWTGVRAVIPWRPQKLSTEVVLSVVYQPLAMFRVLPLTRCSDSMPGHTDAVLHVSFSPDGTILASGGGDGTVR